MLLLLKLLYIVQESKKKERKSLAAIPRSATPSLPAHPLLTFGADFSCLHGFEVGEICSTGDDRDGSGVSGRGSAVS